MKNISNLSLIVLALVVNNSCLPMMTVFKKSNSHQPQKLSNDSLIEVAHRSPSKTKLNVRATCRELSDRIKIDGLEEAYAALRNERKFYVDYNAIVKDRYAVGGKSLWSPGAIFRGDRDLTDKLYHVERELYSAIYNDPAIHTLMDQEYVALKHAFLLAHKLEDGDAQKRMLCAAIPNNRYGLKDVFGMGIVRTAIFKRDFQFAEDMLKANPHGFCNGKDNELSEHVGNSYGEYLGVQAWDPDLLRLEQLAQNQDIIIKENRAHDHCTIL